VVEVIAGIFARYARHDPDRVALIHDDQTVSYSSLERATAVAVAQLRAAGVVPGDHVAVMMPNGPTYTVWMLACLLGGHPIVPVHAKAAVSDLDHYIVDSEAAVLVCPAAASDAADRATTLGRSTLNAESCWEAITGDHVDPSPVYEPVSSDLAYIKYTGGTTGRPKGVMQTHEMIRQAFLMQLAEWPWPSSPRYAAVTPLSHGAGMLVLPTLFRGGTIVTTDAVGPTGVARMVRESGATVTFMVPSLMYSLSQLDSARDDFATMEMLVYGGSPIDAARLPLYLDTFGAGLVQLYGQTEAPMILTTLRPEDHVADSSRLQSCGLPSLGVTIALLDDRDQQVPVGTVGEVCARGPLVMPGYWKNPSATEEALRSDWLHTGDLAVQDDAGYVSIVGRKKDMIISGGFNVFPGEVEAALREHAAVSDVAVFGVPDEKWGEKVVAAVVATPDADLDELRAHVRERKGPIATPKEILLIDQVPLTAVGKPDRKFLKNQVWPAR